MPPFALRQPTARRAMKPLGVFAIPLLATLTTLPAQCLFTSVTTQTIGSGCNVGTTGYCKIVGLPTTTTFTLDLVALLTAPLAFTMFDWQDADGRPQADPLALLV